MTSGTTRVSIRRMGQTPSVPSTRQGYYRRLVIADGSRLPGSGDRISSETPAIAITLPIVPADPVCQEPDSPIILNLSLGCRFTRMILTFLPPLPANRSSTFASWLGDAPPPPRGFSHGCPKEQAR